jgi:carbamoyl-phosphate synthase small subunit
MTVPQIDNSARIILEDGTEFEGTAFGYEGSVSGEIVFYAGQAGIPRLLTDPALRGAILVLAQPETCACGIPDDGSLDALGLETEIESSSGQVAGLVVASASGMASHHSAKYDLSRWLKKQQIPGISGIDTRALIQRLCLRGTMRAKILVAGTRDASFSQASVHSQPSHASTKKVIQYGSGPKRIVLVDCGTRNSTIRALAAPDVTVTRVPWNYDYSGEAFDGLVISGGPGDPTSCEKTVAALKSALGRDKPVFATGQGAVILAIAAGASAFRMAQGHRGSAVPVIDLDSGRCLVTGQNHGYGIRDDSLPEGWAPTFLNNADNSIEGFAAKKGLFSGVLFQPEGYPGPHDADFLYGNFLDMVRNGGIRA